jgi:hypothetical protein
MLFATHFGVPTVILSEWAHHYDEKTVPSARGIVVEFYKSEVRSEVCE